ncbi:MAG: DUF885 domain-containing protein [Solobacterium sp.]|nr:DUF885 domain-containing protein [Solobacterium sp.]
MKMMKKLTAVLAALLVVFSTVVRPVKAEDNNIEFDQFLNDLFVEMMEEDYMTMHFSIADYQRAGITKPDPNIGRIKLEDYADDKAYSEEVLKKLQSFDYESLSETQKHDYNALKFHLENEIALNQFPDFDFAFTPTEGIINNLLTNFTEFVFREKEDIDDYLAVLASTPAFIDDCLELTKTQAAKGAFMTDSALDDTLDQIAKFTAKTDDNQLIIIFDENMDAFEGITDEERADYKARNRDIVLNQYIPSYAKAGEVLETLRGSRGEAIGLAEIPYGADYYAAKARMKSSTDATVEELLDMCTSFLYDTLDEYISIYRSDPSVVNASETVDMETPEEVLTYLQNHLQDYPQGPQVTFDAKYLDPSVANDGIVAYYLNPPLDALKDNVIKINGNAVADINELYETLSHEGFPGHLYQITWYLNTDPSWLRTAINLIGYTEGWAMYSEMRAWEFSGLSANYARMNALDTAMNYVLDCAADLGVNGLGWKEDQLTEYIEDLGFNSAIVPQLIDFVTSDPGVLLPYGIGLLQFETMYKDSVKALGTKFEPIEFNRMLLQYGDRPFGEVRKDMKAWLEAQGSEVPSPTPVPSASPSGEPEPAHSSSTLIYAIGGALVLLLVVVLLARRSYKKSA